MQDEFMKFVSERHSNFVKNGCFAFQLATTTGIRTVIGIDDDFDTFLGVLASLPDEVFVEKGGIYNLSFPQFASIPVSSLSKFLKENENTSAFVDLLRDTANDRESRHNVIVAVDLVCTGKDETQEESLFKSRQMGNVLQYLCQIASYNFQNKKVIEKDELVNFVFSRCDNWRGSKRRFRIPGNSVVYKGDKTEKIRGLLNAYYRRSVSKEDSRTEPGSFSDLKSHLAIEMCEEQTKEMIDILHENQKLLRHIADSCSNAGEIFFVVTEKAVIEMSINDAVLLVSLCGLSIIQSADGIKLPSRLQKFGIHTEELAEKIVESPIKPRCFTQLIQILKTVRKVEQITGEKILSDGGEYHLIPASFSFREEGDVSCLEELIYEVGEPGSECREFYYLIDKDSFMKRKFETLPERLESYVAN